MNASTGCRICGLCRAVCMSMYRWRSGGLPHSPLPQPSLSRGAEVALSASRRHCGLGKTFDRLHHNFSFKLLLYWTATFEKVLKQFIAF